MSRTTPRCTSTPSCPCAMGRGVTMGHNAVLHGCTVGDDCLIGMGAVVLSGAVIGKESVVGAGALVTEGKGFPPRSLIVGSPAKAVRQVDDEMLEKIRANGRAYVGAGAAGGEGLHGRRRVSRQSTAAQRPPTRQHRPFALEKRREAPAADQRLHLRRGRRTSLRDLRSGRDGSLPPRGGRKHCAYSDSKVPSFRKP